MRRFIAMALALWLPVPATLGAQVVVDTTGAGRLIAEATEHSEVIANLQYLSDMIGPRLTGSPAMRKANDWTAERFRGYGLSARLEPWQFGITWERGPTSLRISAPFERTLVGHSWAWTAGTNGRTLSGPVVRIDASSADSIAACAARIRGAWLLLRPTAPVWNPDGPPMSAADSAVQQEARRRQFPQPADTSEGARKARQQFAVDRPYLLRKAGALGILTDGSKELGLMTMSGSPNSVSRLPNVVIAHEDYAMLDRLIGMGVTPRIKGRVENRLGKAPVTQWNAVAEIRGSELPGEVVLLGAHLDSWDLGTGVTDNGAGSMVVLEAARAIAQSGLTPRRTIRFVLFSGEEQGLLGSRAYAAAHAAELDSVQAVLVLDNGTGMITGQALQGRDELEQLWQDLLSPVAALGATKVRQGNKGGTDHLAFVPYGVPAFNFDQESRGYNHTHHSQVDTFDHAVPSDLRQASAVMAVTALELANLPVLLPRGNRTPVTPPTVGKPSPGVAK
jgi:carboxypeptidase Q